MTRFYHICTITFRTLHIVLYQPTDQVELMGTSKKDKAALKKLIEENANLKAKLADVNVKVDDFIASSDETKAKTLNELYAEFKAKYETLPDECPEGQHKDASGNCVPDHDPPVECPPGQHLENGVCVPDVITPTCGGHSHWTGLKCECDVGYHDEGGVCVPNDLPPPPPPPNPAGVIYDSNVEGQWNNGVSRIVKGSDGDIKPNGKGIFTAASGSPEVHIDGKGTAILVTKPGFGRFYLCVTNFNAQLDFDFNIMDSSVDNMSIKGRCRHQSGGSNDNRFGGLGNATSTKDTDFKIEDYHNVHEQGYSKNLPQPLKVGEWYSKRYIYHNTEDNKAIKMEDWIDFKDGKGLVKVFERTETKPIAPAMAKEMFDKESWIWFRLNGSGSIAFKNVKVTAL